MNMFFYFILINAILYLSILFFYIKSKEANDCGKLLLILYSFASICSVYYYLNLENYLGGRDFNNINLLSLLYLFICSVMLMYPVLSFRIDNVNMLKVNTFIIDILSIIIGVCFISCSLEGILRTNLFSKINQIYSDAVIINEIYMQNSIIKSDKSGLNFFRPDRGICILFSDVIYFVLFYRLTLNINLKNKLINYILIIAILLNLINSISYATRSVFFYLIMNLLFCYLLFRNRIKKYFLKRISYLMLLLVSFSIIVLSIITFGRFGYRKDTTISTAIASYMGQSFLVFSEYIPSNNFYGYGDYSFPLIRKFLGLDASLSSAARKDLWAQSDVPEGAFYTHIGCFCLDFGVYFTFLFLFLLFMVFYFKNKIYKNYVCVHNLFLVYIFYNICFKGVFLFVYMGVGGNIVLLGNLFTYLLFKFSMEDN